jgi:hypothetical protein
MSSRRVEYGHRGGDNRSPTTYFGFVVRSWGIAGGARRDKNGRFSATWPANPHRFPGSAVAALSLN